MNYKVFFDGKSNLHVCLNFDEKASLAIKSFEGGIESYSEVSLDIYDLSDLISELSFIKEKMKNG